MSETIRMFRFLLKEAGKLGTDIALHMRVLARQFPQYEEALTQQRRALVDALLDAPGMREVYAVLGYVDRELKGSSEPPPLPDTSEGEEDAEDLDGLPIPEDVEALADGAPVSEEGIAEFLKEKPLEPGEAYLMCSVCGGRVASVTAPCPQCEEKAQTEKAPSKSAARRAAQDAGKPHCETCGNVLDGHGKCRKCDQVPMPEELRNIVDGNDNTPQDRTVEGDRLRHDTGHRAGHDILYGPE